MVRTSLHYSREAVVSGLPYEVGLPLVWLWYLPSLSFECVICGSGQWYFGVVCN